jgi:hypothetical protein
VVALIAFFGTLHGVMVLSVYKELQSYVILVIVGLFRRTLFLLFVGVLFWAFQLLLRTSFCFLTSTTLGYLN